MAKGKHGHRRGGTHRVKDEDRTWTHWDGKTYEELKYAAKERPGIYRKDMKKVEIAKALAADDKSLESECKKQKRDNERKTAVLKKRAAEEQQKQERLRNIVVKKQEDRARRKVAGFDNISDTTDEEVRDIVLDLEPLKNSKYNVKIAGELLSDEDEWDETSDSEAPMSASISPIYHYQKLRIFEWPYPTMPSRVPPQPKYPRSVNMDKNDITNEALPRKIPYAVMNLVTTISEEKVELPGRSFTESVEPDFVPRVSQYAIDCARNGVMIGSLRKALIERGTDWAKRTRLQGWNARMYFHLPPRSSLVSLSDVYAKWNNSAQTVDPRTGRIVKRHTKKQTDKKKDQRQKTLEILAASEWRPPICYLPVYLEYTEPKEKIEGANNVENLFYVRFPGMDLPQFYFWADEEEWADPTVPNPEWEDAKVQDEEAERQDALRQKQFKEHRNSPQGDGCSIYNPFSELDQTRTRVKKSKPPRKFQSPQKPPKGSKYKVTLWNIEQDLYQGGFAVTLYKYRTQWLAEGKGVDWELLSENLPELYPSGKLPETPPVHHHNVSSKSLAEKLAAVEVPGNDRTISPIQGDEPWTRDDDAYWSVISIPSLAISSPEALHRPKDLDLGKPSILSSPVIRRCREASPHEPNSPRSWLNSSSPSHEPTGVQVRIFEREEWEELFSKHVEEAKERPAPMPPPPWVTSSGRDWKTTARKSSILAPRGEVEDLVGEIEEMPVTELKYQLYSLLRRASLPQEKSCRMCLQPLSLFGDKEGVRRHYEGHKKEADTICPFCGMEWGDLSSRWKADHIHRHGVVGYDIPSPRQESVVSRTSIASGMPYSLPSNARRSSCRPSAVQTRSSPRKTSKVAFSPQIVERRITYKDRHDDTGGDGDVDSVATASLRRSSMQKSPAKKPTKRGGSKIDTSTKVTKRLSNIKGKGKLGVEKLDSTPSTPSDHITSPELHFVRQYPGEPFEVSSGLSKDRKSSCESLAYDTGPRGKATKKKVIAKCVKKKSKTTGKPASTRLRVEVTDVRQALAPSS